MSDIFIYNGNMEMQTKIDMNNNKIINSSGIDMNNHKIENLSDATNTKDAINKGQLDEFKNEFERYRFYIKNHSFLDIFSYLVFDFNEPGKFIVKFLILILTSMVSHQMSHLQ